MQARSWAGREIDRYFGPFTYSPPSPRGYSALSIMFGTEREDDYDKGCWLRFSGFGHTFIIALPALVKPYRVWVDTSKYEWSKGPGSGFYDIHPREYGFSLHEGHWSIHYGEQTHDSTTDKNFGGFLPWTQWRLQRYSMFNADGSPHWSHGPGRYSFDENHIARETVAKDIFFFTDYDGEPLNASCYIEEWEWSLGEGLFKWLDWFTKRKVRRSMDINYSGEVGHKKGSWKGGTIGTGIDLLPKETLASAWLRHCKKEGLTPRIFDISKGWKPMTPLTAMDGMEVLSRLPLTISPEDKTKLYILLQRLDVFETLRDKEGFQEQLALADKRDEEIRRAT